MWPQVVLGSVIEAHDVVGAPSWTSMITRSAPWLSLRLSASAFTESTMSSTVTPTIPPGETSDGRSSVTAPTKPTTIGPAGVVNVCLYDLASCGPPAGPWTFDAMYS